MTDQVQQRSFDQSRTSSASTTTSIPASRYDLAYAVGRPVWDIDGPQPTFARLVDTGIIAGRVLDVGCGTGELVLFFASRGMDVAGVDASPTAISIADAHARQRGLNAGFSVGDATELHSFDDASFDTVTDSGFLHALSDEQRMRTIHNLHRVLRPGGTYILMSFNEHAVIPGPRRITQGDIRSAFSNGWEIKSIEPTAFAVRPHDFGENATTAWLSVLERRSS